MDRRKLAQAVAEHQAGRYRIAEASYRSLLRKFPRDPELLHFLGLLHLQTNRLPDAIELIGKSLRINPRAVDANDNMGSALAAAGRNAEAADYHRRALRLDRSYAAASYNLGNALQQDDPASAADAFRWSVLLRPEHVHSWYNLGNALRQGNRPLDAARAFRRALDLAPRMVEARSNLADAFAILGHDQVALLLYREVVDETPDSAEAHYNLGVLAHKQGELSEAEQAYRKAVELAPDHSLSWNNLGNLLAIQNRRAEAESAFRAAISHRPDFAEALHNLGGQLYQDGQFEEARQHKQAALAHSPAQDSTRYDLALIQLTDGEIAEGWDGYRLRFAAEVAIPNRQIPLERWDGQKALAGQGLLLWREQGVGDEMMFASCYRDAIARFDGAVTIETDARLVSLFARSFPEADVRAQSCGPVIGAANAVPAEPDLPAHCTHHLAAGDLPAVLRRDVQSFPSEQQHWLTPDPERLAIWKERVAVLPPGLRIGIGWRSQMMTAQRKAAYTQLSDWAAIFALPGVVLVNLQYGEVEAEILQAEQQFGVTIHRWQDLDLRDDFEGAAALTANLDLVIAPGTSTTELAGALGVPTWRLATYDWTNLGTKVRPWYPTMAVLTPPAGQSMAGTLQTAATKLLGLLPLAQPAALSVEDRPDRVSDTPPQPSKAALEAAEKALEEGLSLHQRGQIGPAAAAYKRALDLDPDNAEATHFLGLAHLQSGRSEEAVSLITSALSRQPAMATAWNHLGLALRDLKQTEAAAHCFRMALSLDPAFIDGWTHLGLVWHQTHQQPQAGHGHSARRYHRRAIILNPLADNAQANLGQAAELDGEFPIARKQYQRALALVPASASHLNNIAAIAKLVGDSRKASQAVRRAAVIDPTFALARFNASLVDLEEGKLDEGWEGYAYRFASPDLQRPRRIGLPAWQGEALEGRRLLIWAEQGLGDVLMFSSCLPDLRAYTRAGGSILMELDERLTDLFSRSFPWLRFRAEPRTTPRGQQEDITDCDLQVPLGSLPGLLRNSLSAFPAKAGYLRPDPVRVAGWRRLVEGLGPGLKVGIAWRSQLVTAGRASAYCGIADWGQILTMPGVVPICLQYGDCDEEIAEAERLFGRAPHRWPGFDLKNHLDDVAALMTNLDLVISPATAVSELAGAVGTPVWRLSQPDWTMLGTGARPWFPGMKIVRPMAGGTVANAVQHAARLLQRFQPMTTPVS